MTFTPNREELAWAAGFFDGEGYIGARVISSPAHRDACARITQCDRAVLDRFRAAVGGIGIVYGPYEDPRPNHNPKWEYKARVQEVQAVMAMLWEFLSPVKRRETQRALDARKRYLGHDNASITVGHISP